MTPQKRVDPTDLDLQQALVAFEDAVVAAPDRPVPVLLAVVGLVRAVGAMLRFTIRLVLDPDRSDPIDLEPRVLRAS